MKRINGYIEGVFTMRSPLSHIGDSHGPESFLATQSILDPQGQPVEIFTYSGNALRGMFRDCGSKYFLDKLGDDGILQIPLDMFYLLFSGGSIGGDQTIDIDQARKIRKMMPIVSIFGGGVGNQILPGKLSVNDAYPVCRECAHIIPPDYYTDEMLSWRHMTTERSYTRTDDAKDENKRMYLQSEDRPLITDDGQMQIPGLDDDKKKKKEKDQPIQMRYTIEVMQTGTKLYNIIDVKDMTIVEFGALISCMVEWAKAPYIGGQSRIGMGRATLEYKWHPHGDEVEDLIITGAASPILGTTARESKQKYDEYLDEYVNYLKENREGLVTLLNAGA